MLVEPLDNALSGLLHRTSRLFNRHRLVWIIALVSYVVAWELNLALFYGITAFCLALLLISSLMPLWFIQRVQVEVLSNTTRSASPAVAMAGEPITLNLKWTLDGTSPMPLTHCSIAESFIQDTRQHDLPTLTSGLESSLCIPTGQRGAFPISHLHLFCSSPFGLIRLSKTLSFNPVTLVVTPQVSTLQWLPELSGSCSAHVNNHQDSRSVRSPNQTAEPASVREYRAGDPRRCWHQSASARSLSVGAEPVVREFMTSHSPVWLLVLDTQASSHTGEGAGSSFECAIRLAASLLDYAARMHQPLYLWADGTTPIRSCAGLPHRISDGLQQLAWLSLDDDAEPPGQERYEDTVHQALLAHADTTTLITIRNQNRPVALPDLPPQLGHLDVLLQEESFLYPVKNYDEGWFPDNARRMQLKIHRSSDFERLFRAPGPTTDKTAKTVKTSQATQAAKATRDTQEQSA